MSAYDRIIYLQNDGKMTKCKEATCPEDKANFLITWNGKDWSGFRTLQECVNQFPELEGKYKGVDVYAVVQR